MPAGRPPKRPGDGMHSPLESSSGASKSKLPRVERPQEDFSSVVKNKLQSYTRTGQACDRCKVRKIRCDQLPDGCTHCTQQRIECYVTDRVTGRTERRGYLQQLEREKNGLLAHTQDLEKLLEDKGIQVRPWQPSSVYDTGTSFDPESEDGGSKDAWTQFGSLWLKEFNPDQPGPSASVLSGSQQHSSFPATVSRPIGGHLGVLKDNAPLSSINGTQLSILGTTIDLTSFEAPDMDEPAQNISRAAPIYNKSLQSFYNSVAKVNPPIDAPLPSRDEAFNYSEWFFVMINAFVPVLHKPTYIKLLTRIYDDRDFKPTTGELVVVHMVFAIMYYQFGVRSSDSPEERAKLNDVSNKHYHWSVGKVWDIASDVSLTSIQALTLIATHCRGFPKPGPAYLMTTFAWNRAIEMDLNRPYLKNGEPPNLESEMRKRTWWSLFMVVVMLYGRLGKPMPIRAEDIDVEYPITIADQYLTEDGIAEPENPEDCAWLVGATGFKLGFLFMDMWNNVCSVRQDPRRYMEAIRRIEQKFRTFQREIPDELNPDKCKPGNRVLAIYLESSSYEFLFCLRHPSRSATNDPVFLAENYRICEDAAKKILMRANELARLKSLDTTWYQMAVYVASIFTLLASRWENRAETTSAELAALKEQVSVGLSVVSEISKYIGNSYFGIVNQISAIINRTVTSIEQDMNAHRSSRTSTPQYSTQGQQLSTRPSKHDDYGQANRRPPRSSSNTPNPVANGAEQQMPVPRMASGLQNSTYYNSPLASINSAYSQMGYPELGSSAISAPTTGPSTSYIPVTDDGSASNHQYLYTTSATAPAPQHIGYGNQPPPGPAPVQHHHHQQQQQHAPWMSAGPGNPWNEWTSAMGDPSNQDRYSANALLTLGGSQRGPGDAGGGNMGHGVAPGQSGQSGQWPMLIFHPPDVSGA